MAGTVQFVGRAVLGAGVLTAVPALAAPSSRLTYERSVGAEHCPDETALRRAVEQRLGYDPFFPWADRTIVARIRADGRALRGTVELVDEKGLVQGSRDLSAPVAQCAELVSGMALAISIAIDPASVERAAKPGGETAAQADDAVVDWSSARAEEARSGPVVVPPARDAAPKANGADPASAWVPELAAGAAVAIDVLPAVGLGPSLAAAIRNGAWSIGIEGRYLFGFDTHLGRASVSSSFLDVGLLGCLHASVPFACVGASVGRLTISGERGDAAAVARLGPRVGADVPLLPSLALRAHAELSVDLGEQVVQVDSRAAWTSPRLGGFAGISLLGRFP